MNTTYKTLRKVTLPAPRTLSTAERVEMFARRACLQLKLAQTQIANFNRRERTQANVEYRP